MNEKLRDENLDTLFDAFMKLNNRDEFYCLFEDLCTISEMKAMAQRFQVAKLLSDGIIYTEIEQKTGASSATISRVNKCLNYGANGYRTAIERLEK